jgi:hypothetical protein
MTRSAPPDENIDGIPPGLDTPAPESDNATPEAPTLEEDEGTQDETTDAPFMVEPNAGMSFGGTIVTVRGVDNVTAVRIGAKDAGNVIGSEDEGYEVIVPATDTTGEVDVEVSLGDGTTLTLPGGFVYL